jgi:class 3 adenylate cyclase
MLVFCHTSQAFVVNLRCISTDVVHSMDIAAAVGPERLREIIADLADRCAAMVQRNGGTVSAEDIANKSPDAVSGAKYLLNIAGTCDLAEGFAAEQRVG